MTKMTPQYSTLLFSNIYSDVGEFTNDYTALGIPQTISIDSARTLYYLLYARYANTPIANRDLNQFKYKLFSVIFQFGPTWEKKLDIQNKIRSLSEEDLMTGSKVINNHAFNPGNEPGTASLDELNYINEQNSQNYKKSKAEAYMTLWNMLAEDVTESFIDRFKVLFKLVVYPEDPLLYYDDENEEEE